MTKENLVTAPADTSLEEADRILTKNKVEKLLLVDDEYRLKGLITIKDIDKLHRYPHACKDERGRLLRGRAVGVNDFERISSLLEADVDVLIVDSAHGHSLNVIETVRRIKRDYTIDVDRGQRGDRRRDAGPDRGGGRRREGGDQARFDLHHAESSRGGRAADHRGLPGRQGRRRTGADHRRRRDPLLRRHHQGVGRRSHCVMIGGLFAGLAESPGDTIIYRGRSFKAYRGWVRSERWPKARTNAIARRRASRTGDGKGRSPQKLVPEGVEGRVPYKGPLADYVFQLIGGLRAGMGYCGTRTIEELRTKSRFIQVTGASVLEGHPHDIVITQEAPNYSSFSNESESGRGSVQSTRRDLPGLER